MPKQYDDMITTDETWNIIEYNGCIVVFDEISECSQKVNDPFFIRGDVKI